MSARSRTAPAPIVAAAVAAVVALLAIVTAGCTPAKHAAPQPSPSIGSSTAVVTPAPASSASAAAAPRLPAGCPELLPLAKVQQALGVGLLGQVTYLKAAPVPTSGRTGRVTCGYGTPVAASASPSHGVSASPAATPLVQASYITYVDAKTAAARVDTTVQADGATSVITQIKVNGKPAAVLVGPKWNELLMADGSRTIVIVVSPVVLSAAKAVPALTAMAEVMLQFGVPKAVSSSAASSGGAL
ncbi:MAG: hypothetical protein QOC73_1091 [Actinomycetota bacterium]|nr:hypothetical protein [Actinomycetota bacterium]